MSPHMTTLHFTFFIFHFHFFLLFLLTLVISIWLCDIDPEFSGLLLLFGFDHHFWLDLDISFQRYF